MATKKATETVKAEAPKAAAKVEAPKVEAPKAEAPKTEAPKAAPAKKAPAKKAPAKKAAKLTVFVEAEGKQFSVEDITAKVQSVVGDSKDVTIYVKPEDGAAYYVAGDVTGKVEI